MIKSTTYTHNKKYILKAIIIDHKLIFFLADLRQVLFLILGRELEWNTWRRKYSESDENVPMGEDNFSAGEKILPNRKKKLLLGERNIPNILPQPATKPENLPTQ